MIILTLDSVCITSIERMISLNFNATFAKDFTWATGTSVIWTQIESTVGVICACAPSLRQPLARFIPKLLGTQKSYGSYPLSGDVSGGAGPRSTGWPDRNANSKGSKRRGELTAIDDMGNTTYVGDGSEERIIGIKKTVTVDMTNISANGKEDMCEYGTAITSPEWNDPHHAPWRQKK